MDQLGISNTVDRTDAFRVARVATPDVSSCSGFWVRYVRMPLRKLATKNFRPFSYFGRMSQCLFVSTKSKDCLFLYARYKRVLYCIIYCTSFLSFQFTWNIWNFAKNGGFAINGSQKDSMTGPMGHSWNHAFYYKLPVLYKIFYLLFKC